MKILVSTISFCNLFISVELACAQTLLFTNHTYRVGMGPISVAAADLNGDGKLDLITANVADNTLTILTNDGNGGFASNATLNVGSYPDSVIAVDINGCGRPDLVCANGGTNTLIVLTNNGSGIFGSNATLNVGEGPSCVVAADVNGDGRPDLISANYFDNTLSILTNDSNGGFVSNATLNVDSYPHGVVAADVNGDGKRDIIVAARNWIRVLTNDGSGNFTSNLTLDSGGSRGTSFEDFAVTDFNGDGRPDLIPLEVISGPSMWLLLTNDGTGSFGTNFHIDSDWHIGNYGGLVVAADVNGDTKPDLVFNSGDQSAYSEIIVLTNNGSGVFGTNIILNVGSPAQSLLAADLNNDGRMDMVTSYSFFYTNYEDIYTNTITVLTQIAPLPTLTIIPIAPNAIQISWPWTTNFVLQTNMDLSTANWGIPGYAVSTNAQTESVTVNPLPSENLFFRLMSR